MSISKTILSLCLLTSGVAHASFQASFSSIPVTVLSQDGKGIAGMRVQYKVTAVGKGTCRSDHPWDLGHACPTGVEITKPQFVITDANGKAVIPAVKATSSVSNQKDPQIEFYPVGVEVKTKDHTGKPVSCARPLVIDWSVEGSAGISGTNAIKVSISEKISKEITNKNISFVHAYIYQDLAESYLKTAAAIVNREIRDYEEEGLQSNTCIY